MQSIDKWKSFVRLSSVIRVTKFDFVWKYMAILVSRFSSIVCEVFVLYLLQYFYFVRFFKKIFIWCVKCSCFLHYFVSFVLVRSTRLLFLFWDDLWNRHNLTNSVEVFYLLKLVDEFYCNNIGPSGLKSILRK